MNKIMDFFPDQPEFSKPIYGVVTGIVTNIQDPDGLSRVKVKISQLDGKIESNWARLTTFMAGNGRGAFFLPEVGDEVLVVFEFGDINRPYVIGALWNGIDKPPVPKGGEQQNNLRVLKSRSGHSITFDDKDGQEKIVIADQTAKNRIEFNTQSNSINIVSAQDIILSAPNGKVTIGAGEIAIESDKDIDVKAKGNSNIKGATINLN